MLVASSLLSMGSVKKKNKILLVSAMVPSIYAAVSAGIVLYVCSVFASNVSVSNAQNEDYKFSSLVGFTIFASLALLITTITSTILLLNKFVKPPIKNSESFNYAQFSSLDEEVQRNGKNGTEVGHEFQEVIDLADFGGLG